MESVKQLVAEYQDINHKVQNLNRGGCGVFAEQLYITLKKMGYKPKIVVLTRDKKSLAMFAMLKTSNTDVPLSVSIGHVAIQLKGKLIDSKGIHNTIQECWWSHYPFSKLPISLELLKIWNSDNDFWNNCFDRKNIKTIEKKLADCYKKINKNLEVSI